MYKIVTSVTNIEDSKKNKLLKGQKKYIYVYSRSFILKMLHSYSIIFADLVFIKALTQKKTMASSNKYEG